MRSAGAIGRLAWWGVRRQRWRTLVIVLMLALPVAAGVTLDIVWSSEHTTVAVAADELAGRASSVIGPPDEFELGGAESRTVTRLPIGSVPPGDRAVLDVQSTGLLYSTARSATPQTDVVGIDLRTGVFAGTLSVRSGDLPTTTSEVALTESLADALGVRPGSTIGVSGSELTLRVSGIIANRYEGDAQTAYVLPQIAGPLTAATSFGGVTTSWLVIGPASITGAEEGRIEKLGLDVVPRDRLVADEGGVAGHPLPGTSVPLSDPRLVHGLIGGMIILEVALLAGPAFAIGARRRRHELATLSVVGARPGELVGVALVDGILLGLTAAVGGLMLGVALGAAIIAGQRAWSPHLPDALTVHGWAVAGVAALAVVAGLLAAIPSAWRAGGRDRPEPGHADRRLLGLRPASGLGLVAVLVALGLAGTNLDATSGGPVALFAAAALGEIGLALLAPEILSLAGRVADRLPVWPRLALRDAARQHSAAVPAVAAIIAVVAAATTALVAGASYAAHDRAGYTPYSIVGDAQTSVAPDQEAAATTAVTDLRRTLPPASGVFDLRGLATCGVGSGESQCSDLLIQPAAIPGCPPAREVLQGNNDSGFGIGTSLSPDTSRSCRNRLGDELELNIDTLNPVVLVADGAAGAALIGGTAGAATRAALDAGKAVAFSPGIVGGGRVSVTLGEGPGRTFGLPAVFVDDPGVPTSVAMVVLPPGLAARIPVGVTAVTIYVKHASTLRSATLASANHDLARLGFGPLAVETGFDDSLNRQLLVVALADLALTVAAAVTSTALIALDNQADLLILEALGAAARGRRRLAAARAGVLCLIGALFGAVAGIIPGIGLIWRLRHITSTGPGIAGYPIDLPWLRLAAVALAAPLVAVIVAALVVRTHPDLTRREGA